MPIRTPPDAARPTTTTRPTTTPDAPTPPAEIAVATPAAPAEPERDDVAKKAAEKLLGVVEKHKDVAGTAEASAGKGDARITERRSAMSVLLASKAPSAGVDLDALAAMSASIKTDIEWLKLAERQDYQTDVADSVPSDQNPFRWMKSDMTGASSLLGEYKKRLNTGKDVAKALDEGTKKHFDVSSGSLVALTFLKDADKRAAALADALLQFRGRTDLAKQDENAGGQQNRIDRIGPALVAEQRVVLAGADLALDDPSKLRELALLKQVIAAHPLSSSNGIFEARNAVGNIFHTENNDSYFSTTHPTAWITKEIPPGASASAYKAIHHNYSRDTPHNIKCTMDEWIFPLGDKALRGETFGHLTDALQLARGDVAGARDAVKRLGEAMPDSAGVVWQKVKDAGDDTFADALRDALAGTAVKSLGTKPESIEKNLLLFTRLFRAVCATRPTVKTLERELFRAGDAWPEVADVIVRMQKGDSLGTLKELGEARQAMRDALVKTKAGFERQELILFDAKLERLTTEELGAAVDRVGDLSTDAAKAEAMLALQTALRSSVASGLHAIKDPKDPAAQKGEALDVVLGAIDAALSDGKVNETEYRELMSRAYVSVARTVQNIRSFVDSRAADVAAGGVELDPQFLDQLVKQTPLHYATALAQKGMRVGLHEVIGDRHIQNPTGVRVLNSIGPVVFDEVVFAQNTKELVEKKPSKDALSILWELQEKKMVAVGGLIVDAQHAPGGNSHLNMYAMNNGIAVLALPELRAKYGAFLERCAAEGGLFLDDRKGELHMMTVQYAIESGKLDPTKLGELSAGTNRKISYLKPNATGDGWDVAAKHEAMISPERHTREVELYIPQDEVRGLGRETLSFTDLATLGRHGRHLAGEKGLVLALMKADPTLAKYIPDGSIMTTGRVRGLLKEAGILAEWDKPWTHDPKVGVVDDSNFLASAFYTDGDYRARTREHLKELTMTKLQAHLLTTDASGNPAMTDAGKAFYDELMKNPALEDSLIYRSSYTGEDRPGKSGAGQYESYVDRSVAKKMYGDDKAKEMLKKVADARAAAKAAEVELAAPGGDAAAKQATLDAAKKHLEEVRAENRAFMGPVRLQCVIGVIESAWHAEPVENNVADEVNLKHILPSVTIQNCLDPQVSGVMISRDIEHGTRGQVSYQLVKGFGGGVDGGKTEEGVLTASGHSVKIHYPDEPNGLVPADALKELRTIVLGVEKFFHDVVEPGKGYAVDMEVARENDEWKVVQARVILMDK